MYLHLFFSIDHTLNKNTFTLIYYNILVVVCPTNLFLLIDPL